LEKESSDISGICFLQLFLARPRKYRIIWICLRIGYSIPSYSTGWSWCSRWPWMAIIFWGRGHTLIPSLEAAQHSSPDPGCIRRPWHRWWNVDQPWANPENLQVLCEQWLLNPVGWLSVIERYTIKKKRIITITLWESLLTNNEFLNRCLHSKFLMRRAKDWPWHRRGFHDGCDNCFQPNGAEDVSTLWPNVSAANSRNGRCCHGWIIFQYREILNHGAREMPGPPSTNMKTACRRWKLRSKTWKRVSDSKQCRTINPRKPGRSGRALWPYRLLLV
jgi:hypothetical protein